MTNNNNKSEAQIAQMFGEEGLLDSPKATEAPSTEGESSFLAEIKALTRKVKLSTETGKIAPRMFRLEDKMVFAFLLEETEDGYLVAFPATLKEVVITASLKSVIAAQLVPNPVCKFLKANISILAFPAPPHLLAYLQSSTAWFVALPGYFSDSRKTQIESLISVLRDKLGVDSEVLNNVDTFDVSTPDKLLLPQEYWPKQRH